MEEAQSRCEPTQVELPPDAPVSPEPPPPPPSRGAAWRYLLQIRPEEVLVIAVVALFVWLQSRHYLHFQFATNFIVTPRT